MSSKKCTELTKLNSIVVEIRSPQLSRANIYMVACGKGLKGGGLSGMKSCTSPSPRWRFNPTVIFFYRGERSKEAARARIHELPRLHVPVPLTQSSAAPKLHNVTTHITGVGILLAGRHCSGRQGLAVTDGNLHRAVHEGRA